MRLPRVAVVIKRRNETNKSDPYCVHLRIKIDAKTITGYIKKLAKILKKYVTRLRHLKSFQKQIVFSDIDNHFVQDFRRYLERELNLQGAACKKYMAAFKRVHKARKEDYTDASQMEFLFDGLKIKVPKSKRNKKAAKIISRYNQPPRTKLFLIGGGN